MNDLMDYGDLQVALCDGENPVMRLGGELTSQNCSGLARLLGDALEEPGSDLRLDLGGLDFVDSSGVRELVKTVSRANADGRTVSILSITDQLHHVLTVTGLRHLFTIDGEIVPDGRASSAARPEREAERRFSMRCDPAMCRDAREVICDFAAGIGFREHEVAEIKTAVGEAVSNAVRHGAAAGDSINIVCRDAGRRLVVTLSYPSAVFDPAAVPLPVVDECCQGGMGIFMMRLIMDRVDYSFHDGFVDVTIEKSLPQ